MSGQQDQVGTACKQQHGCRLQPWGDSEQNGQHWCQVLPSTAGRQGLGWLPFVDAAAYHGVAGAVACLGPLSRL